MRARRNFGLRKFFFAKKRFVCVLLLSLKFTFYECLCKFYATNYKGSPPEHFYTFELLFNFFQNNINWQMYVRWTSSLHCLTGQIIFPSSSRGPKMGSPSSSSLLDRRRRVSKQKELSYESICDVNRNLSFLLFRPLVNFME